MTGARRFKFSLFASILVVCGLLSTAAGQAQSPNDLKITIQRSVCYGSCPDYTVMVLADGTVNFEGRQFVAKKGAATGHVSSDDLRKLISAFDEASYFALRDRYTQGSDGCPEVWTDNPTVVTSIRMAGKSKTIVHYHGCQEGSGQSTYPKALTELESKIDEIVGTSRWIKGPGSNEDGH